VKEKRNQSEARRSPTVRFGQSTRAAKPCVYFVNFVNLPTPYCICNVKNGQKCQGKRIFKRKIKNLHYIVGTPTLCSPSSQSSQVHKMAIFGQFFCFSMKKLGVGGVV